MKQQPALVIMAAGMGSRFGGIKQMTAIDDAQNYILDYSLFDAWRAGFRRAVLIIRPEMEPVLRQRLERIGDALEVLYVHQNLYELPEQCIVPSGRTKPWGTAHAVACCREVIDQPFAVLNADDFYGRAAFEMMYHALSENLQENGYYMIGYRLRNTLTDFGAVSRGVCQERDGFLTDITERKRIYKRGTDAVFTENGEAFHPLSGESLVSMNFWGFPKELPEQLYRLMPDFLARNLPKDPERAELNLADAVKGYLKAGQIQVRILSGAGHWYGMTYREDLPILTAAISDMKAEGQYPAVLWK